MAVYEERMERSERSEREIYRQRRLLDAVMKPELRLHRVGKSLVELLTGPVHTESRVNESGFIFHTDRIFNCVHMEPGSEKFACTRAQRDPAGRRFKLTLLKGKNFIMFQEKWTLYVFSIESLVGLWISPGDSERPSPLAQRISAFTRRKPRQTAEPRGQIQTSTLIIIGAVGSCACCSGKTLDTHLLTLASISSANTSWSN